MRKIMIIGCPGSGKSTFGENLHKKLNIPLYHLDLIKWKIDGSAVSKSTFLKKLEEIFIEKDWIIDGNYNSTIEMRLKECDTVFFLDYPLDICLNGIKSRKGKIRKDITWDNNINEEENTEFMKFIKDYNRNSKPIIMDLLQKYNNKNIYIFKSREEADEFLKQL